MKMSFVLLFGALPLLLRAQTDECCLDSTLLENLRESDKAIHTHLDFSDSAGRGMGMAGIFVPIADDASASFSNPSGLSQLARPVLAVSTSYAAGDESILPFLAVAFPRKKWTFGLHYVQLVDRELESSPGFGADLDITALGFSITYFLNNKLHLGAGVNRYRTVNEIQRDLEPGRILAPGFRIPYACRVGCALFPGARSPISTPLSL